MALCLIWCNDVKSTKKKTQKLKLFHFFTAGFYLGVVLTDINKKFITAKTKHDLNMFNMIVRPCLKGLRMPALLPHIKQEVETLQ